MKKITLNILLLFFSILAFGQTASVTVTNLKVLNQTATTVNFGTNVTSVNVSITASVVSSSNTAQGAIMVRYKRNSSGSTTPVIPTNGYDGSFYLSNGFNGTKTFTFTLNRSEFDDNGGVVYVEYQPNISSILTYKSSNIIVTKLADIVPAIQNNTITISGSLVQGSTPTGGTGVYTYRWLIYAVEGEIPGIAVETTKDYNIPQSLYNWVDINNVYIERQVFSGSVSSISNYVAVTRPLKKQNNTSLSGQKSTASLLNKETGSFAKIASLNTEETTLYDLAVYPNPTSESLNFSTNFSTDKEIEILLYSEKLGNEKSVFKGNVTPNQVVTWDIPSNYQKGIYFYKIISDNKEVKTGKVIFQ